MEENIPQYRPGQFIGINAPGKYKVTLNHEAGPVCSKCDIFVECWTKRTPDLFKNNKSCTETIGWNTYVVKVK